MKIYERWATHVRRVGIGKRSGGVARISRFTSNTNYYQGNTNYYYVLETLLFFASTSVATKNQLPTVPVL